MPHCMSLQIIRLHMQLFLPALIQQRLPEIILQNHQVLRPIIMQGLIPIQIRLQKQMPIMLLRTVQIIISANQPIRAIITGAAPITIPGIRPEMQTAVMATAIMPTVLMAGKIMATIIIRNGFIPAIPAEAKGIIAVAQAAAVPTMDIPAGAMQAAAADSAAADIPAEVEAERTLAAAVAVVTAAAADIGKSINFNERFKKLNLIL